MIPKRMSFFWHGGRMSWMRWLTLASFRQYNPDWEVRLYEPSAACAKRSWRSHELDDQEYQGRDYVHDLRAIGVGSWKWSPPIANLAPAHACDIFQWGLLAEEGGWFSDMDILYCQPMGVIYGQTRNLDAVFCLANGEMAVGFAASSGKSPLFTRILAEAKTNHRSEEYQCSGVDAVYRSAGMWPVKRRNVSSPGRVAVAKFMTANRKLGVATVPDATVYPYDWRQAAGALYDCDKRLPSETIGVHWFGGLKASQERNLRWTPDNYADDPCTFTRLAKMITLPPSRRADSLPVSCGEGW